MADGATIPGALLAAGDRFGGSVALDDGERSLTYAELRDEVLRGASALIGRGVAPGDRVALWGANTLEWVTASLAVLSAGAVVVPVNSRYRSEEATDIVVRSACRLVLADGRSPQRALAEEAMAIAGVEQVLTLEGTGPPGAAAWGAVCAQGDAELPALQDRLRQLAPGDVSHVQFTSGTTGRPKGAALTHGAMVTSTRAWAAVVGLGENDGYPVIAPFSHIGGHKTGIVACLVSGATLRPMRALDVEVLLELIGQAKVSILQGPPALFHTLISEIVRRGIDTSAARVAVTGAAVVPPALVHQLYDVLDLEMVITAYGLTETTGVSTMTRRDDPIAVVAETCGRPIEGVQIRICDPEGLPVPQGGSGEVEVKGPNLMSGYLDDPAGTAETMHDGWLRTGDVGIVDHDGNLRIVDRLKDMIVVGGFNVYPAEIERVLGEHPTVDQVAVVGDPDERMGELPVAFVVAANSEVDADQLMAYCGERLAGFKVPRRYVPVGALPLNSAGKMDKVALRAALRAGEPLERSSRA